MSKAIQLKKTDLLAIFVADAVFAIADAKAALRKGGFAFVDSYVDYLIDHFIELGRLRRTEDGSITRTGKVKVSKERTLYRVFKLPGGEFKLHSHTVGPNSQPAAAMALEGWRNTPSAAIKFMRSSIFALYKELSSRTNELSTIKEEDITPEPTDTDAAKG